MSQDPTTPAYLLNRYGIPITPSERWLLLMFRGACYAMLLAYMAVILINAVAIVACFLGVAMGRLNLGWQYLASWAGGTTGLGAGSLLFKSVLDYLFGSDSHATKSKRSNAAGSLTENSGTRAHG